jgi:hypothetical protein
VSAAPDFIVPVSALIHSVSATDSLMSIVPLRLFKV